jgi:imidazolonepropionase
MIYADTAVANISQLVTCAGDMARTRKAMQAAGLIEKAWVAGFKGQIVFAGTEKDFRANVSLTDRALVIDGSGLVGLPGLVDCHTHLPFAGDRAKEFSLRIAGYTYQQLAELGLGIQTTVKATRAMTAEELEALCWKRLETMLLNGTTTIEAKSGYGLNHDDELKQLQVLRNLARRQPVSIVPTFMGAHEIPRNLSLITALI